VSLNEEVDLLRRVPLFSNIEPSKLKLLAFTSERLTFRAGQSLCVQGEIGDAAYVIIEGQCDVTIDTPNGSLTLATVGQDDFVGEIAILCDVPRTATVTATDEVTVLKISKDLFLRMISEFPQMGVEVMRELAARLERTTIQLREARIAAST
tara:strand:+ start:808 stop:1263 length:456 start_codon:yes stop_codon:yes gene_type:complete